MNGVPPNDAQNTKPTEETGSSDETGNHRPSSDSPPLASKSTVKSAPKEKPQKWRTFTATAYIALCDSGCSGVTATGIDVRHTRYYHGRVIAAVDPAVIPLGTALTIRLADGSEIEAIAQDTGGRIKGRKIDVLMANEDDAWDFRRQTVSVRIDAISGEINE